MADHIGRQCKMSQNELSILIYAVLHHDIGAASDWDEKHFIVHSDYVFFQAYREWILILKDSPQLNVLAEPIRYHHDRYHGGNLSGLVGEEGRIFLPKSLMQPCTTQLSIQKMLLM